eukprot:scaffold625_cov420-Prasinococcus_capsulatus_cf.AAC.41
MSPDDSSCCKRKGPCSVQNPAASQDLPSAPLTSWGPPFSHSTSGSLAGSRSLSTNQKKSFLWVQFVSGIKPAYIANGGSSLRPGRLSTTKSCGDRSRTLLKAASCLTWCTEGRGLSPEAPPDARVNKLSTTKQRSARGGGITHEALVAYMVALGGGTQTRLSAAILGPPETSDHGVPTARAATPRAATPLVAAIHPVALGVVPLPCSPAAQRVSSRLLAARWRTACFVR